MVWIWVINCLCFNHLVMQNFQRFRSWLGRYEEDAWTSDSG